MENTNLFILMLVVLNPFAQLVYLQGLMRGMSTREFAEAHLRASLLTLGVFSLFVAVGEPILSKLFHVRIGALQIFGGLIMLQVAHRYITVGAEGNLMFRGKVEDLAPQISLPYMVGPGTIWLSILAGQRHSLPAGLGIVAAVLAINFLFVVGVQWNYHRVESRKTSTALGQYFSLLQRTNALFIGALAVEMIIQGVQSLLPPPS